MTTEKIIGNGHYDINQKFFHFSAGIMQEYSSQHIHSPTITVPNETLKAVAGLSRSKFGARGLSRGQITLRARLNNKLGGSCQKIENFSIFL